MSSTPCSPRRRRSVAIRLLAAALLSAAVARDAKAGFISIVPTTSTLAPGGSETITVQFTSTETFNLDTAEVVLDFDSTRFTTSDPARGAQLLGTTVITQAFNGVSEVFIHNPAFGDITVTPGQVVTLMTFQLNAKSTASAGPSVLNLDATFTLAGNSYTTRLNGGAITLSPPPTNGFDPSLDATVTISAVPEPASVVLLGSGALLVPLIAAHRRRGVHQKRQHR